MLSFFDLQIVSQLESDFSVDLEDTALHYKINFLAIRAKLSKINKNNKTKRKTS